MNISVEEISPNEYQNRKILYEYYFEILEGIKGVKKVIEPNEFKEMLFSTTIETILHYIKESIPILINKKILEFQNLNKETLNNLNLKNEYIKEYQLLEYENQIKFHIKNFFQLQVEKESLANKIKMLMKIENEYQEMKEKLKYNNGHFLDNDRKENEIEILRRENSNIKKALMKIEEENENLKSQIFNEKKIIKEQKEKINSLKKKIEELEKKFKDSNSNSSINININNNGKSISKWIFKRNVQLKINNTRINNELRTLSSRKKILIKKGKKRKISSLENTFSFSFNNKINRVSSEKSLSPNSPNYNKYYYKTNSINKKIEESRKKQIVSTYYKTKKSKFDLSKISKLIKESKHSKKLHRSIFSTNSKMLDYKNDKNITHS